MASLILKRIGILKIGNGPVKIDLEMHLLLLLVVVVEGGGDGARGE